MVDPGETIVIPGSRGKLVFFALFAGLLATASAWFSFFTVSLALNDPSALLNMEGRYALYAPFAPILVPCFTLYLVYLAVQTARKCTNPPYLELGPAGVTRISSGRRRTWPWDQLQSLEFDPWRGRLIFNGDRSKQTGGRFGPFPMMLNISSRELLDLLVEGKRRWGGVAAPHDGGF